MKDVLDRVRSRLGSSFLRDVAKLSLGTLGGRLIALAALPFVTRLYSPADFVLLATYLALVSTIAVAACLRMEIAIPLADTDADAAGLLLLAIIALSSVVLLVSVPILLVPDQVAMLLGNPGIERYLWLVPLGVAMAGSYSALQFWSTRARRFGDIARTRVGQAATGVVTMLGLGSAGVAPLGLLLGHMLNIGAGGIRLGYAAMRNEHSTLRAVRFSTLGGTLRRYRRYPIYSTPEALANVAGMQIPILIIAAVSGGEAGQLFLAMQVMAAPMTLLGISISQVYVSRAPTEYREGRLAPFTLGIMRRLVLVGVGPLILAGALAPVVFPWLFGAQWARAGEIVTWLVPWMALQFVGAPISMVMHIVGWQRAMLVLTTLGLVMRVVFTVVALGGGFAAVECFAVASAAFHFLRCAVFISAAKANISESPRV